MDCTRRGCMPFEEVVSVNLTKSTNSTKAQTQNNATIGLRSDKNALLEKGPESSV